MRSHVGSYTRYFLVRSDIAVIHRGEDGVRQTCCCNVCRSSVPNITIYLSMSCLSGELPRVFARKVSRCLSGESLGCLPCAFQDSRKENLQGAPIVCVAAEPISLMHDASWLC
ncbi:hypothetical protein HBH52_111850 [Parastagonospora nodorum]|nr:hypothetical protein HBH52_111850 [Parastagonospora nodorum]KAH5612995.1 hypothetical protein HBI45_041330 [Parastagonospora nodorum]